MNGTVLALAVDGAGNLYAGGGFTSAGGVAANDIAKWDGSAWSALGSGMNGDVVRRPGGGRRRQPLRRGRLHHRRRRGGEQHRQVGRQRLVCPGQRDGRIRCPCSGGGRRRQPLRRGRFTTAGGVAANHIAKWNGSAWSALGSGIDGYPSPASLPWRWTAPATSMPGAIHHRRRRGGEPHRQVGRQRLVRPGQRDRDVRRLCPGGGRRRQPLRRGQLHYRWRRGGEPHRQMGRQHLVCPGQRDEPTRCHALAVDGAGNLYAGGSSPLPAAWRRTTSPSGMAAPGLPWAAAWDE